MKEVLQDIGINISISVAGLFGSLLLIGKQSELNLKATFFSILSCGCPWLWLCVWFDKEAKIQTKQIENSKNAIMLHLQKKQTLI